MGWTYRTDGTTLKQLIADMTSDVSYADKTTQEGVRRTRCIAKCFKGNPAFQGNLWTVWNRTLTANNGDILQTQSFIVLYMLRCIGRQWGYKDVDESMGPCEINCPIKYIEMCTSPVNEYAAQWRERVIAAFKRRARPKAEIVWILKKNNYNYKYCIIEKVKPLVANFVKEPGDAYWPQTRLRRSLLDERTPQDEASQLLLKAVIDGEIDELVFADKLDELGIYDVAALLRKGAKQTC